MNELRRYLTETLMKNDSSHTSQSNENNNETTAGDYLFFDESEVKKSLSVRRRANRAPRSDSRGVGASSSGMASDEQQKTTAVMSTITSSGKKGVGASSNQDSDQRAELMKRLELDHEVDHSDDHHRNDHEQVRDNTTAALMATKTTQVISACEQEMRNIGEMDYDPGGKEQGRQWEGETTRRKIRFVEDRDASSTVTGNPSNTENGKRRELKNISTEASRQVIYAQAKDNVETEDILNESTETSEKQSVKARDQSYTSIMSQNTCITIPGLPGVDCVGPHSYITDENISISGTDARNKLVNPTGNSLSKPTNSSAPTLRKPTLGQSVTECINNTATTATTTLVSVISSALKIDKGTENNNPDNTGIHPVHSGSLDNLGSSADELKQSRDNSVKISVGVGVLENAESALARNLMHDETIIHKGMEVMDEKNAPDDEEYATEEEDALDDECGLTDLERFKSNIQVSTGNINAKYKILETIGRGTFAEVKRAECLVTGKVYAVKILQKSKIGEDMKESLDNEREALKLISKHPGIASLYEIYEDDATIQFVMQYFKDGPLFEKIAQKLQFSENDARLIFHALFKTLNFMAALGVVHRDIKPENLLVDKKNARWPVILTDFGLSAKLSSENKLYDVCGTPLFVAPEVLQRKGYTGACDVWSMGIVLYIILCGYPPFYSDNSNELFQLIVNGDIHFPGTEWDRISDASKDFITKILRKNPSERMTPAEALKHPWLVNAQSVQGLKHEKFKSFNARRKMNSCIFAVTASNNFLNFIRQPLNNSQKPTGNVRNEFGSILAKLAAVSQHDPKATTQEELSKETRSKLINAFTVARPLPNSGLTNVKLQEESATVPGKTGEAGTAPTKSGPLAVPPKSRRFLRKKRSLLFGNEEDSKEVDSLEQPEQSGSLVIGTIMHEDREPSSAVFHGSFRPLSHRKDYILEEQALLTKQDSLRTKAKALLSELEPSSRLSTRRDNPFASSGNTPRSSPFNSVRSLSGSNSVMRKSIRPKNLTTLNL